MTTTTLTATERTTDRLRSIDLYLDHPPGEVHEVEELVDVGCGVYPVYYRRTDDALRVSTSAAEVIADAGDLVRDEAYVDTLPTGLDWSRTAADLNPAARLIHAIPSDITANYTPDPVVRAVARLGIITPSNWSFEDRTVDERVRRLRPFERVTADGAEDTWDPTFSLSSPEELVERSATHLTGFVNDVERRFPDHQHVVLTGGRDSQLISLVPKETDNWHVFSAHPNAPLVEEFVAENDLDVNRVFTHDNVNRETRAETRRKLLCSDVRNPPRDMRWRVRLADIAEEFDGDCIFWCGTAADAIYSHYPVAHGRSREEYFGIHTGKVALGNGITHQTTYNFTGSPLLSPYHSERMWQEVYRHYDPTMMEREMDLRDALGERLHGEPVAWPDANPSPSEWRHDHGFNPTETYLRYVQDRAVGAADSAVGAPF